jgi:hypothetical protein
MRIDDGTGKGPSAKVTKENKLTTTAVTISPQMHMSAAHGLAYQVLSGVQTITGANGILAIQNDGPKNIAITYMRIACDKTETAQMLSEIFIGGDWAGGGTAVTPVSLNKRFNLDPGVTALTNSIPTGSPELIDTRWLKGPDEVVYNKEGSIILPTSGILSIKVTPETASVKINARVSFVVFDDEELQSF